MRLSPWEQYIQAVTIVNFKPNKEKSTEYIGSTVALIMALDRALRNHGGNGESVYDERGLLIFLLCIIPIAFAQNLGKKMQKHFRLCRSKIRFQPLSAFETPEAVDRLTNTFIEAINAKKYDPFAAHTHVHFGFSLYSPL